MNLQGGGLCVEWSLQARRVGKVRRRVLELRYPSSHTPPLDLSHSESARLATDALLQHGLHAYADTLAREAEVDFLSQLEKSYILSNTVTLRPTQEEEEEEEESTSSDTYLPGEERDSEPPPPYGWPSIRQSHTEPGVDVLFQSNRSLGIRDLLRQSISKATTVLAIVMDTFSDVELFCDILEATKRRCVSVYLLLDLGHLHLFVEMCENLQMDTSSLTRIAVRSVQGKTYVAKGGAKFVGEMKEKFVIIDGTQVLTGSFSFTWLSWQVHRGVSVLLTGSNVTPFELEFRHLYASSQPVLGFPAWPSCQLSAMRTHTGKFRPGSRLISHHGNSE